MLTHPFPSRLLRSSLPLLLSVFVVIVLLQMLGAAHSSPAAAQAAPLEWTTAVYTPGMQTILENPSIVPPAANCKTDAWYPISSGRGHTAFLTLNTQNPAWSTNSATWRPNLPAQGYYRIEAYIPVHDPITWCTSGRLVYTDTAQAHYTIQHALGSKEVVRSQALSPTASRWIDLGEFQLPAGAAAVVRLIDLNSEDNFTRTVSFSAMRFTYLRPAPGPYYLPIIAKNFGDPILPPTVAIRQGQAFDSCTIYSSPDSLEAMQTWWNSSPYEAVGLYLGGISYATGCSLPTPAWVAAASRQGWGFMPLWVGPQAPCYGYRHPMDLDPAVAYQQGRYEAGLASAAAFSYGLTGPDQRGTLIYYNLEAYGSPAPAYCQAAVNGFINGWTERLHELGNAAGVYAAACASHPTDLIGLPNTPEYLWVAAYYATSYDAHASVFGMPCLSNSLWANHQRIRQYAGGHKENWGGVGFTMDSNVMDGAIVVPNLTARATQPETAIAENQAATPSPVSPELLEDTGWLSPEQGWLVQSGRLYWTSDRGQAWENRAPTGSTSIRLAAFRNPLQGWALSAPPEGGARLYQTQDGGVHWDTLNLPVSTDPWQPVQLELDSRGGWIVLRRATSQAFDLAVLLRSSDGGLTWQSSDLPASGAVTFTASGEAWLETQSSHTWYYKPAAANVSSAWQPATAKALPLAAGSYSLTALATLKVPPGAIVLSGASGNSLAWAVTRQGECTGEKASSNFACTQTDTLWLTQGENSGAIAAWQAIPQP